MPRANVLVIGPDEAIERFLDAVLPTLRQPVFRWSSDQRFRLPPAGACGTVIIENAAALTLDDQRWLFDWLTVTPRDAQIVSTTATSLLSMVETGAFLEALYYRLNTICIDLTASPPDRDAAWVFAAGTTQRWKDTRE